MAFLEIVFPLGISYGSRGGPGYDTAITALSGGAEQRVARREKALRTYDASIGVRTRDDIAELVRFYHVVLGSANGFRWKDWDDYSTSFNNIDDDTFGFADVIIGTGDGIKTTFQLVKKYQIGAVVRTRNLQKPVPGKVRVGIDGSEQLSGWSVNTTTGVITFTSAPTAGQTITAGCEFDVPARFEKDLDTALLITDEEFDVRSAPIPVVEILDPRAVDDEFFFGGAADHGAIASSLSITLGEGRVHVVSPASGSYTINLPDYTNLPEGGPYFYLVNNGAVTVTIKDHLNVTVGTIPTVSAATIILAATSGGGKKWYAL